MTSVEELSGGQVMKRLATYMTEAVPVWLVVACVVAPAAFGREAKLAICPAKVPAEAGKYSLLPKEEELTDADAVPLYRQAAKAPPEDTEVDRIRQWRKLPAEQLPQKQAEQMLQKHMKSLRLIARAARCKQCNWPEWKPGMQPEPLSGYRQLAFVVVLWARLEISRGAHDGALLAMQTGFGMARHIGQGPTIVEGLVGMAMAVVMREEVAEFARSEGSPNLYWALANLPEPFVDVEKAIELEKRAHGETAGNKESAYERVRTISKRLENDINIVQCVEAIRHYAATHNGQLPVQLSDITELEVPRDVNSGKALKYRRTAAGAVLATAIPEGGNERDAMRYDITVKN
jgi:hypothetical protein